MKSSKSMSFAYLTLKECKLCYLLTNLTIILLSSPLKGTDLKFPEMSIVSSALIFDASNKARSGVAVKSKFGMEK